MASCPCSRPGVEVGEGAALCHPQETCIACGWVKVPCHRGGGGSPSSGPVTGVGVEGEAETPVVATCCPHAAAGTWPPPDRVVAAEVAPGSGDSHQHPSGSSVTPSLQVNSFDFELETSFVTAAAVACKPVVGSSDPGQVPGSSHELCTDHSAQPFCLYDYFAHYCTSLCWFGESEPVYACLGATLSSVEYILEVWVCLHLPECSALGTLDAALHLWP